MTLKDIAKQLTTAVQTVPNLVQILRDGLEQATAGSTVEVTQVVSSGTKIASVKVDNETTDLYAPSAAHNYSTTEHVVGKWIDNKDIYEKTITGLDITLTSNEWSYYAGLTGVDVLIELDMYSIVSGRYIKICTAECTRQEDPSDGIMMQATSISNNREVNVIVARYTKQSQ